MFYQPPRALGLMVGAALIAWSIGIAALLALGTLEQPFGLLTLGTSMVIAACLAVAAVFAYWTYSLATLSYALDRNGLVIRWGITRQVIPLSAIERLVPGTAVGVPSVQGVSWMGYHIGRADIARIGNVLFYSTHQTPEQVLYVMTTERNYAISVPDPAAFARQIQVRQDLGPTAEVSHHVERTLSAVQGFWGDRGGWLLAGLAIAMCAAAWLVLAAQYGDLPETVRVFFPPADRNPLSETNSRDILLHIPRAATVVLTLDLVAGVLMYAWDRTVARLVLGAGIAVQVGFLVALQLSVGRA
ncbi:MAG: PH domain-containing protein [Dehalococcoidia bacterium]